MSQRAPLTVRMETEAVWFRRTDGVRLVTLTDSGFAPGGSVAAAGDSAGLAVGVGFGVEAAGWPSPWGQPPRNGRPGASSPCCRRLRPGR